MKIYIALLIVIIITIVAYGHNTYVRSESSTSQSFLLTTFRTLSLELLHVTPAKTLIISTMSSRDLRILRVEASPWKSWFISTFSSKTSALHIVEPSRSLATWTSLFNEKVVGLSSISPARSYGNIAPSFNALEIALSNVSQPLIKAFKVVGKGFPRPHYFLAGYSYSVVIRTSDNAERIGFTMSSSNKLLLKIDVDVPSHSYRVSGALANYVKSVKIERGSIIVNTTFSIPWNRSLQGSSVLTVVSSNAWGSSSYSMNASIVEALTIINTSYPRNVYPGQRFEVTLWFAYNGTNIAPPPGTSIIVNGTTYSTDPQGKISVAVRAPSRPGASTITLIITDPANISIPVKIRVTVTPTTTTRTATAYATTPTPIQASSTTRTTTQRSTTYVASGGGSLGGTAKSMLLPALLFVTLVFTVLIASIVAKLRKRS